MRSRNNHWVGSISENNAMMEFRNDRLARERRKILLNGIDDATTTMFYNYTLRLDVASSPRWCSANVHVRELAYVYVASNCPPDGLRVHYMGEGVPILEI